MGVVHRASAFGPFTHRDRAAVAPSNSRCARSPTPSAQTNELTPPTPLRRFRVDFRSVSVGFGRFKTAPSSLNHWPLMPLQFEPPLHTLGTFFAPSQAPKTLQPAPTCTMTRAGAKRS